MPCGKCADCRRKEQQQWETRLRCEFNYLKKQGWNLGFITLTYSPDCLPTIPEECFKDPQQYKEIPCFDKASVRKWIQDIRQYCKYHFGFKNGNNVRYFITSEYGGITHRPHYHALIAWPKCQKCDDRVMHALCDHFWSKGIVGPQKPEGDRNCRQFLVEGDNAAVVSYVSKYVSKDIDYVDQVEGIDFYENSKQYDEGTDEKWYARKCDNCKPFHLQSISLGYEPIRNLTDDEKLDLIVNGISFVGDDKMHEIPMYIKNKLIYSNYYVVDENGKRLVRREATRFFEENRDEFFEKKSEFYTKYITQVNRPFLEKSGVESEIIDEVMDALNQYWDKVKKYVDEDIVNNVGKYYLAFNAVQSDRCFDIPLVEQWMLRYRRPENVEECYENEKWPLFDGYKLSWLQLLWNYVNCVYFYVNRVKLADREEKDRLISKLRDFWNNIAIKR